MDDLFGVTELAKQVGDEETAHPTTEIHESTADAIAHEKGVGKPHEERIEDQDMKDVPL